MFPLNLLAIGHFVDLHCGQFFRAFSCGLYGNAVIESHSITLFKCKWSRFGKGKSGIENDKWYICMYEDTNNHNVEYFSRSPRHDMRTMDAGNRKKWIREGLLPYKKYSTSRRYYSCRHIRIIYANQRIHFHKQLN